jgi:PKD domain
MRSSLAGKLGCAFVSASVAMAFAAGAAAALAPHPHVGRLPGFPRERGVVPVLDSPAAVSAHERLVKGAFDAARVRRNASEPSTGRQPCPEEFAFTHNVCYLGGPVLRKPVVHLIFWLGPNLGGNPTTPKIKPFPPLYLSTIERYFTDVAHDAGALSDVYAVDPQYSDKEGRGVNGSAFEASNAVLDAKAFPLRTAEECSGFAKEVAEGPCVLDSDVQKEVASVAGPNAGLGSIYFVFTPEGVSSCASFGCSYNAYCAYHGDFGGDGVTPGPQTIYANMPFQVVGVCDSGVAHPNEAQDGGTDAAIDTASHEFNEAVTDPLGSQCKSEKECEPSSWTDAIGQEIGDKCLPPESTVAGAYGEPLGGSEASTLYNQLINGDHYWTQREWSNEAGQFEGGCVQRAIGASFSVSAGAAATVPVTFDGSASGAPGDPAAYWVWSFEGEQIGTASPTTSYTFAQPGEHAVGLTAYDARGNGQATVEVVKVGPAPPAPPPQPPAKPLTVTVREPASPPAHLTAAQLAAMLGLPPAGKRLGGSASIALGHAECPPACAVTLQLFARVTTTAHKHRSSKLVPVGTLHILVAAKGAGSLALALSAKGRALLRKSHTLACRLLVTVEGQEGGTWQIVRSLTLTSGGSTARHVRR